MTGRKDKRKQYKTIHFVSLGCPKNRVDSEVMAGIAAARGLKIVAAPEDAEVIVVNTCAFIESAKQESVDTLLEMDRFRSSGRLKRLVSAGCLSQRYGNRLTEEMPEIDVLIGTEQLEQIAGLADHVMDQSTPDGAGHYLQHPETPRVLEPKAASAYLKIADGCSRRCAFCAIPAIRGKARSRPLEEIVAEAERLAARGVKELNIVAQDTSAYGRDLGDGTNLTRLVHTLSGVSDIAWIRLLYLYPDTVTDDLLRVIDDLPSVVPYLDIPIQHASSRMLRKMRRGHGRRDLERLIKRVREAVPAAFLRTAVLVGHPAETADDFAALVGFLEWARFDHLGAFRYSNEEGTASFDMEPKTAPRDSYNRLRKVMALSRRISRENNRARKGQLLEVLVEDPADEQGYVLSGRHLGQAPEVDGATYIVSSEARIGEIIRARVIKTGDFDLVVEPRD